MQTGLVVLPSNLSIRERMLALLQAECEAIGALIEFLAHERHALIRGDATEMDRIAHLRTQHVDQCNQVQAQRNALLKTSGCSVDRAGVAKFVATHGDSNVSEWFSRLQLNSLKIDAQLKLHAKLIRLHLTRSSQHLAVLHQAMGKVQTYNAMGRLAA